MNNDQHIKNEIQDVARPLVYIVILNWNNWRDTLQCLEAVFRLDYPHYKTVVVDNGSEDDSVQRIEAWGAGRILVLENEAARLTGNLSTNMTKKHQNGGSGGADDSVNIFLIKSGENLGFTGGCNIGVAYSLDAGADHIFLLNNDAKVKPDTLTYLIDVSFESESAIVGAQLLDEETEEIQFAGSRWPLQLFGLGKLQCSRMQEKYWPSSFASGCALLANRQVWRKRFATCGYFLDPKLFMYCEDVDFCLFADSIGYSCTIAGNAFVLHEGSKISGGQKNPRSYYYLTRNRILLANRWLGLGWLLIFHFYYLATRILIAAKLILSNKLSAAKSIGCGLLDAYFNRSGKWQYHGDTQRSQ